MPLEKLEESLRENSQETSLLNDGHAMFFWLWLASESWHCLAQMVFSEQTWEGSKASFC